MAWRAVDICDPCYVRLYGREPFYRLVDDGRCVVVEACHHCGLPTKGVVVRAKVDR